MRFNTRIKRIEYLPQVINYLTSTGWEKKSARHEAWKWVDHGLRQLTETPREDIRRALIQIRHDASRKDSRS